MCHLAVPPSPRGGSVVSCDTTGPRRSASAHTGSDVVELAQALQVEYAGAVPAEEVSALVRGVAARLEADGPGARLLLRTTEAASRRALTDHLARGVPLPR